MKMLRVESSSVSQRGCQTQSWKSMVMKMGLSHTEVEKRVVFLYPQFQIGFTLGLYGMDALARL